MERCLAMSGMTVFLANDTDIDIGMWIEDYDTDILMDLQRAGFEHVKTLGTIADGLQLKLRYNNVPLDIVFYYHEEGRIWNNVYSKWAKFKAVFPVFDLAPVNFKGIEVMAPNPPALYLTTVYGPQWKRVVYRWNYKYLAHNYEIQGSALSKLWYNIQRNHWLKKNPDIYLRHDGTHANTVYTDGVFDLFHANHALTLQEARAYGDRLVVGVVSDAAAKAYKRQPMIPERERLRIVQSNAAVDEAFIFDGPWTSDLMEKIVSDYAITTVVYAGNSLAGFEDFYGFADARGFFRHLQYHNGVNTTEITKRLESREKVAP